MKLTSVLACLAFALAAAVPFQPWAAGRPGSLSFEVRVDSDESGLMTLYCDMGRGPAEADPGAQTVVAGRTNVVRFRLPAGTLHGLRLELLDRDGRRTRTGSSIVDGPGRTVAVIGPGQFEAANQLEPLRVEADAVRVRAFPGADHPQVAIRLANPVVGPARPWGA